VTLVRPLPEDQCNLIAAECKYFIVLFEIGAIEPCLLRNNRYQGVIGAWTETEVLDVLARRRAKISSKTS
jgi:hypothetical protein